MCSNRWRSVAAASLLLPVLAVAEPENAAAPVGLLRSVEGTAYVISDAERRQAEPFVGLSAGDQIVVETGKVVVADIVCGGQHELAAGSTFVMRRSACETEPSLLQRLRAALDKVRRGQPQTVSGVTREGVGSGAAVWPDSVSFAASAAIMFRWDGTVAAESFRLNGPEGAAAPTRYQLDKPSNPLRWPEELARRPGRYRWEIRGGDGKTLGRATFEILSSQQAATKRAHYRNKAKSIFPDQYRDVGAELLAAGDGCLLN
ncbi:MAG: hypothetical protein HY699_07745 [Deltaproteobacteria bacterium]|nr:hypothetical protein [Deltaproteobacteria bacterium]